MCHMREDCANWPTWLPLFPKSLPWNCLSPCPLSCPLSLLIFSSTLSLSAPCGVMGILSVGNPCPCMEGGSSRPTVPSFTSLSSLLPPACQSMGEILSYLSHWDEGKIANETRLVSIGCLKSKSKLHMNLPNLSPLKSCLAIKCRGRYFRYSIMK